MKILFFSLAVILFIDTTKATDKEIPITLFTCTIPSDIMSIDVSCVQRGVTYEIVEGSNLAHPMNIIKIEKPLFKNVDGKCLFSFQSQGKEISIDKSNEKIFTSTKNLGKCTFSKNLEGCNSAAEKRMSGAPLPQQQMKGGK